MKKEVVLAVALTLIVLNTLSFILMYDLTGNTSADGTASVCFIGPPDLQAIADQTIAIGATFTLQANCSVACNEPVTYSNSTSPNLNNLTINSTTGNISFTAQDGDQGTYTTTVYCDKGSFSQNSTQFTITVGNATPAPTNLDCQRNEDLHSVNLNWTTVAGADNYTIYYSTNISALKTLDTSAVPAHVSSFQDITGVEYNDTTAFDEQQRYYTVASVSSGTAILTGDIPCAKHTYRYTAPVSGTYGTLASTRITLYFNASYTAEDFLQELPGAYNPTISRLDKSDGSGEFLTTHVRGLADGNDFTMQPIIGYQVTLDSPYNQTVVGKIYNDIYILEFDAPLSGTYGTLATNWRGIYHNNQSHTAETFLQLLPAVLNPTISRLDKTDGSGEFLTTHVRGLADGNDFTVEYGTGYAFTTDTHYNLTICTTDCFGE